jgi:SNF2 family DNA or RNA helicase
MAVSATDTNTITPTELRKLTVDRFRKSVADQQYILKEIITMCENVEKEMNKEKELNGITTRKFTEYQQRYQELQYKIKAQEEIVKRRITVLESYETLLENITDIVSTTAPSADADMDDTAMDIDDVEKDKLCPICYGTMSETIVFYSNCRHCICRTCFERLQKTNPNKCSICRDQAEVGGIVFISNSSGQVTGTKNIELLRLINRCPEKKERFIIFTQYAKMIKSIMTLLSTHDINAKTYPEFSSSTPEEKDSTQIIVLSSTSNASGIDLSFIQNVIIIEPFENYIYGREIEKQLIGRVHRINQTKEVNVFRLIISGTIEEEMYQLS